MSYPATSCGYQKTFTEFSQKLTPEFLNRRSSLPVRRTQTGQDFAGFPLKTCGNDVYSCGIESTQQAVGESHSQRLKTLI